MAGPWEKYASPAAPQGPWSKYAPLAQPKTFESAEDETLYREKLAKEQQSRTQPMVPFYASEPGGPERNLAAERRALSPEEAAVGDVQQQRAEEAEEKEFAASRTAGRRVADTAAFLGSIPVRTLTRGEYGIGDAVGAVAPEAGKALQEREANFARANEAGLEVAKAAGEVTAGIPMLSTMGAPVRGMSATASALANKPLPQSAMTRGIVRNERLADIEAFEGSGVKPFGPALTEAGTAGTVKQLADAPVVGAPVRRALEQAITETRDAGERIAGQYGDARTYRDVGNVAEQGLNRFKDARAADLGEEAAKRLTDDEISAAISRPARESSIKTKQDALYERAWRGIPDEMQKGKSKKDVARFWGGMGNTQEVLKDFTGRNQRMFAETRKGEAVDQTLAYPVRGGVAGRIVQD